MIPMEGIDKIKCILNPILLNRENTIKYIDPHNKLTLHAAGAYTALCVHSEYFDVCKDYQWQITCAVYELIKKGIILFKDDCNTLPFIYNYPWFFIIHITELEFYSNYRPANVEIAKNAVFSDVFHPYYDPETNEPTDTLYFGKYNPKQGIKQPFIRYNKDKKDRHDNHISRKELDNNPYKTRLEYRLTSANCGWLHWINLRGNYYDILKRYCDYLAIFYCNYIYRNLVTHGKENVSFNKIKRHAKKYLDEDTKPESGKRRYKGKKLTHSEMIPKHLVHPETLTEDAIHYYGAEIEEHFNNFRKAWQNNNNQ